MVDRLAFDQLSFRNPQQIDSGLFALLGAIFADEVSHGQTMKKELSYRNVGRNATGES
jgi:hypothetical protein